MVDPLDCWSERVLAWLFELRNWKWCVLPGVVSSAGIVELGEWMVVVLVAWTDDELLLEADR